jgi:hypothetical protein
MVSKPMSDEEVIKELQQVLSQYSINVEDFLKSDIDDYSDANLRDLWLFVKELRKARSQHVA